MSEKTPPPPPTPASVAPPAPAAVPPASRLPPSRVGTPSRTGIAGSGVYRRSAPLERARGLKLRHKAMLAIAFLVTGLLAGVLVSVGYVQKDAIESQVYPTMVATGRAFKNFQESQFRLLQLVAHNLADSPRIKASLEEALGEANRHGLGQGGQPGPGGDMRVSRETLRELMVQLAEGRVTTKADVVIIADAHGQPLARVTRDGEATLCERVPSSEEMRPAADPTSVIVDTAAGGAAPKTVLAPRGAMLACGDDGLLVDAALQPKQLVVEPPVPFAEKGEQDHLPPVQYWTHGAHVYQICGAPLRHRGVAIGWYGIGFRIEDSLAVELTGVLRQLVGVIKDGKLIGSSMQPAMGDAFAKAYADAKFTDRNSRTLGKHRVASVIVQGFQYELIDIPLGATGARIVVLTDLMRVMEPFEVLRRQLLGLGAVMLLLAAALSWALARGLTRPIETINKGMARVAEGDLKVQLSVGAGDELGQLADSFNEMVMGLYEREMLTKMVSRSAVERVRASHEAGDHSIHASQRIEVTVLFSDVRDFTSISERMGAEDVVSLLNEHFDEIVGVIRRHKGDIDKFIGDAVMATFHADHERDHAEAAVLCAVEMQEVVRRRNELRRAAGQMPVEIGVGLNSGEVVEGSIGSADRMDLTVLGDVVNVASRLEGFCKQGRYTKIVISDPTFERVRHLVDAELMSETRVKGKKQDVLMYEVKGLARRETFREGLASDDPGRRLSSARILARFAEGDDADLILRLLRDPDAAVRRGVAALAAHIPGAAAAGRRAISEALDAEKDEDVAVALMEGVALLGDHTSVELVAPRLTDDRPLLRAAAVAALAALGGRGAAARIAAMLADQHVAVVSAATRALIDLGRWDVLPQVAAMLADPALPRRVLGARALEHVGATLADRRLAIEVHRRRDSASAYFAEELERLSMALSALASDPGPEVRAAATAALEALRGAAR